MMFFNERVPTMVDAGPVVCKNIFLSNKYQYIGVCINVFTISTAVYEVLRY